MDGINYYDRAGKRISQKRYMVLRMKDGYCRVAADSAGAGLTLSTVWLGLDHNWAGVGPPLIFETALFIGGDCNIVARYSTLADAIAGHFNALERFKRAVRC